MFNLLVKYLTVYLSSMLKFVAGPLTGIAAGLSYGETALFTMCGMMTVVLLFTFTGKPLRDFMKRTIWKNKRRFTRRNRQFVFIWRRWGLKGVCFLTPLILTPIGGAILANLFGGPKKQIITYMLISSTFWSCVISGVIFSVGDWVI
ncbi:hypothetical protein [Nafulsella turpanensis]|uniref:hypothetical protein n=1 Tax=Nafulsella turpanensis TaxID=1265690 RepID=UPI00034CF0B0|nr:hypothetical protein [Nafulsella turpanensis]